MEIRLLLKLCFLLSFFNIEAVDLIYGDAFKAACEYSYDQRGLQHNPDGLKDYWFVTTYLLPNFFEKAAPSTPYVLVSHNADHGVEEKFRKQLNKDVLVHWFGQNVLIEHPKLSSIPIGLCNFADHDALRQTIKKNNPKSILVYANFNPATNPDRRRCLRLTGVKLTKRKPFTEYLDDVSRSYFVISPDGNGVDCHRTWEALYLKAIPITTRSINILHYKNFPIIILDSWKEYKKLRLSPELYHAMWKDFDFSDFTVLDFLSH